MKKREKMLLSSELYCEFIWGQQSIHLPTAGLPRPHFSFCMCQCAGKAGCHCWWQDRGLGCNSLPAQEAADTTAPTPSTTADQQAQIFSHLWYITSSLQLFPMQKHPNLSRALALHPLSGNTWFWRWCWETLDWFWSNSFALVDLLRT